MTKAKATMEINSEKGPSTASSSAAASPHKPYSAREIGELMNSSPLELMNMNIGLLTRWYDCDFIEEILRHIEKELDIKMFMTLIMVKWQRQVDERLHNVCHFDPSAHAYVPYVVNLPEKLNAVYERVIAYRKHKEEERQMEEQWLMMFGCDGQKPAMPTATEVPLNSNSLEHSPASAGPSDNLDDKYSLSDLSEDVRSCILIDDDELYSDFVVTLKGPVKQWINKHNLQDWNVVRFICRLRGIVTRKCSLRIFGKFLEKIGLGNQESNMKQRQDANKDTYLKDYDDPKKKHLFWKLKRDGDAIEQELKPIIERLTA